MALKNSKLSTVYEESSVHRLVQPANGKTAAKASSGGPTGSRLDFHPIEYRGRQREIYGARSMPIFRHSPRLRMGVRSLPGCPGGKRQIYYGASPGRKRTAV